jgi:integrase
MKLTELAVSKLRPPEKGQKTYFDDGQKGFGLRISQGGSKTFIVVHGKDRTLTTLGRYPDLTLKDARKRAVVVIATFSPRKSITTSPLYSEAVGAFLEARKTKNKATTIRLYKTYLNFFAFQKKVDHITRSDITEKLKKLREKPTAQNVAQNILRTFLLWCQKEDYCKENVLSRVESPNKLKSRDRVLTDEELTKIWHATDYPYGHLVRVLMLTGARRSEIARYGTGTTHLHFEDTKNGHAHMLPITPLVRDHLPIKGEPHWGDEKKKLDKKLGIAPWRLHDLRRTFSTNMARLKVPIHVTEKILNHIQGSISDIAKIYMRYEFEEEIREALLTHEAFILKIVRASVALPPAKPVHGSQGVEHDEIPQQKGTASGNNAVNSTHHP